VRLLPALQLRLPCHVTAPSVRHVYELEPANELGQTVGGGELLRLQREPILDSSRSAGWAEHPHGARGVLDRAAYQGELGLSVDPDLD
jgi:hypothetical protein